MEHSVLKEFRVRQICIRVSALLPLLCDLDKVLSLLGPQFPHLQDGMIIMQLKTLIPPLVGLVKIKSTQHSAWNILA